MAADIINAITGLLGAVTALVAALGGIWLATRKINAVEAKVDAVSAITADTNVQVTTLNGKSLAQLGDATETRRIDEIPKEDRTVAEAEHIAVVPTPA